MFPLPRCGITIVGGVGDREGGSGICISAFGAGNRSPKTGAGAVRLFIVLRRLPDGGGGRCEDCSTGVGLFGRARTGITGDFSVL